MQATSWILHPNNTKKPPEGEKSKGSIGPAVVIALALVLLIPVPIRMKDGGSVEYKAMLYSVTDVHRLPDQEGKPFLEGTIIEIFGVEVFNNVE